MPPGELWDHRFCSRSLDGSVFSLVLLMQKCCDCAIPRPRVSLEAADLEKENYVIIIIFLSIYSTPRFELHVKLQIPPAGHLQLLCRLKTKCETCGCFHVKYRLLLPPPPPWEVEDKGSPYLES
jgi:hypothetical protein